MFAPCLACPCCMTNEALHDSSRGRTLPSIPQAAAEEVHPRHLFCRPTRQPPTLINNVFMINICTAALSREAREVSIPDGKGPAKIPQDWLAEQHGSDKKQALSSGGQQDVSRERDAEAGSPPAEEAGTSSSPARSNRKVIRLTLLTKQLTS